MRLHSIIRHVITAALVVSVAELVLGDERAPVTIRYVDPTASSVGVVGDFTNGKALPMEKGPAGVWTKEFTLRPGVYGYKFMVNGSRAVLDPKNSARKFVRGLEFSTITVTGKASVENIPAPSPASRGPTVLAQVELPPQQIIEFDVPLSDAAWDDAAQLPKPDEDEPLTRNTKPKAIRLALAVPRGFDPKKSWPILLINSAPNASCLDQLMRFYKSATDAGWVALTADAADLPANDSVAWRWAIQASAFVYLHANWPASKSWPTACAGFDGGAKRSGYISAVLLSKRANIIGLWLGGCNKDTVSLGLALYQPSPARFGLVPIYLSSGQRDVAATPDQVRAVLESLKANGFKKVRLENNDGGHELSAEQIKQGLAWFLEEAKK